MTEAVIEEKKPVELVAEYVMLRNQKKAASARYEAWERENITDRMKDLEIKLLDILNTLGANSLAGPPGTGEVHKIVTTSVTVADKSAFMRHVIGSEDWDLTDWRASKTAINDMVEKGEPLPPGINRTQFVTVGVRSK